MPDSLARAKAAIDLAHAADPTAVDGRPAEQVYVERILYWVGRLVPAPSAALLLAARAQHLERWALPRRDFPAGKAGYFRWRKAVQRRQGQRVEQILVAVGCERETCARVAELVAKDVPGDDAEGQALEDAACLVFLERELARFAASHADYPRQKLVDIVRKTWARMSPAGHALAGTLALTPELADLLREATEQ